jgi:hypothetical protein
MAARPKINSAPAATHHYHERADSHPAAHHSWEKSPFQAQVYFSQSKQTFDEPMSGLDPLGRRDVRSLILRLRDRGCTVFFSSHVLSDAEALCSRVAILAKGRLVTTGRLTDMLATKQTSMLDLPAQFDEISGSAMSGIAGEFTKYGLELREFFINAITPPEEVQKAIDTRSSMGVIGDLQAYTVFQAASSIGKMAENQGGGGGWVWAWVPATA